MDSRTPTAELLRSELPACDDDALRATLDLVARGQLSPADATLRLTDAQRFCADEPVPIRPNPVPLGDLVARLGTPPSDVVDSWCDSLRTIAVVHEANHTAPLPPLAIDDLSVNACGDLVWREITGHTPTVGPACSIESERNIRRILGLIRGEHHHGPLGKRKRQQPQVDARSRKDRRKVASQKRLLRRLFALGSIAAVVGCILYIVTDARRSATNDPTTNDPTSTVQHTPGRREPTAAAPGSVRVADHQSPRDAGTDDHGFLSALSDVGPALPNDSAIASLDLVPTPLADELSFAPIDALVFGPHETDAGAEGTDTDRPPPPGPQPSAAIAADLRATVEDSSAPPESSQATAPTRGSKDASAGDLAIQLPPIVDVVTELALPAEIRGPLRLTFPASVGLAIPQHFAGPDEAIAVQQIVTTNAGLPIAEISHLASGSSLRWKAAAATTPAAGQLAHGKLIAADGSATYLRPTLTATAVTLEFDESDRRPTWDLQLPPPPRASRLWLEFELPDGTEVGWIKPIDPQSVRRETGIAVISDAENEFVSLAYRLDIRCTKKLSVRIRSAARLDASMPWQWVTSGVVNQWLDQLTQRAILLDQQSAFLASLYERSGTSDRRDLRPRRDAIKAAVEHTRDLSERVVSLQAMMDRVAAEGHMQLKVTVEWPNATQAIFETSETPE